MSLRVRPFEPADRAAVERLRKEAFSGGQFYFDFDWRHLQSPTPKWLWVGELDDRVVYFGSYLGRLHSLGTGKSFLAATGGDAVTDGEFRGQGIARRCMGIARAGVFSPSGPVLGLSWSADRLAKRFYTPEFGYCPVPTDTQRWTKLLSAQSLIESTAGGGETTTTGPILLVRLHDADIETALGVTPIRFHRPTGASPDVTVRVDPVALGAFSGRRRHKLVKIVRSLIERSLAIRVRPTRIWPVFKRRGQLVAALRSLSNPK